MNMAVGVHWEWRGFGHVPLTLILNSVPKLKRLFGVNDPGTQDVDEYLWSPGMQVNLKLRKRQLKFKRREDRTSDGCELWTERSEETFAFPLTDQAVAFVERNIPVQRPPGLEFRQSYESFIAALPLFTPPLHLVVTRKHRIQFAWNENNEALVFELSEIQHPLTTWSVGIEGGDLGSLDGLIDPDQSQASLRRVLKIRDHFGLPGPSLRVIGYLELLSDWSRLS